MEAFFAVLAIFNFRVDLSNLSFKKSEKILFIKNSIYFCYLFKSVWKKQNILSELFFNAESGYEVNFF